MARNRLENLPALTPKDQVKFVICSRQDYDWSKEFLREHGVAQRCQVLFSPSYGRITGTQIWRIGYWRIVSRSAFSFSSTKCCGATFLANESRGGIAVGRTRFRYGTGDGARQGFACHALSVHYGQRHGAELDAAKRVAAALGALEHRVMGVDLAGIGGSAMTDLKIAVPERPPPAFP